LPSGRPSRPRPVTLAWSDRTFVCESGVQGRVDALNLRELPRRFGVLCRSPRGRPSVRSGPTDERVLLAPCRASQVKHRHPAGCSRPEPLHHARRPRRLGTQVADAGATPGPALLRRSHYCSCSGYGPGVHASTTKIPRRRRLASRARQGDHAAVDHDSRSSSSSRTGTAPSPPEARATMELGSGLERSAA